MTEPQGKVFCKNCEFCETLGCDYSPGDKVECHKEYTLCYNEYKTWEEGVDIVKKNKNNDCRDFVQKKSANGMGLTIKPKYEKRGKCVSI